MKISCDLLNVILKVKNSMLVWVQKVCKCMSCWLAAAACHPTQHQEKGLYHTGLIRDRITTQNLNYSFYWTCITFSPRLKLKNHKLNQVKSGTVCTRFTHILCSVKILKKFWSSKTFELFIIILKYGSMLNLPEDFERIV